MGLFGVGLGLGLAEVLGLGVRLEGEGVRVGGVYGIGVILLSVKRVAA
jgi:hypothetical protein